MSKRSGIVQKVRATIRDHCMIVPGDHVLVAVSGGKDSVALLHILHSLQNDLDCRLHAAHFDHGLRGVESREDAEFVARLAGSLDLPLISESAGDRVLSSSKGVSLEEAARSARYAFLDGAAEEVGATKVATGHTADDQAETVLMRIIQGTGPGGLSGIRGVRDHRVIRPLIRCRTEEIAAYLGDVRVSPREDSTNRDVSFLRNRVRHRLLPLLKQEFNPRIVDSLLRISSLEREVDRYLRRQAGEALREIGVESRGKIGLALEAFRDYDVILQLYILRAAIDTIQGRLTDVSHENIQALLRLAHLEDTPFKKVTLPGSLVGYRERDLLVVERSPATPGVRLREIVVPGKTAIPELDLEIHASMLDRREAAAMNSPDRNEACFDWEALQPPLWVRGWQPGDRFRPSGMRGTKKVQDFFVDEKVPKSVRGRTPLLVDERGIHWIVGYRTSESSMVRPSTRRVLRLRVVSRVP